jgi:hypothetical protein
MPKLQEQFSARDGHGLRLALEPLRVRHHLQPIDIR